MHCRNFVCDELWKTGAQPPKFHVSQVVLVRSWEEQLPLTFDNHPRVIGYAKNQAMEFDVPYLDGDICCIDLRPPYGIRFTSNWQA